MIGLFVGEYPVGNSRYILVSYPASSWRTRTSCRSRFHRMGLWHRLNKEGLLLLALAALPAAIICYNIGYLELTEGGIEWSIHFVFYHFFV